MTSRRQSEPIGLSAQRAPELILDGSVTLVWAFEDETSDYAEAILDRLPDTVALVPANWSLEVADALWLAERRGRITQSDTGQFIATLETLLIQVDDETSARALSDTLHISRAHGIAAYDAAFLELAIRTGLPLATLDAGLQQAAATVGVALYTV